ncbi:MAG TPA: helix-turn-helix transcriptional regulator [Microscillaceae bacterium]|nr:helix-turn-helix transcriptional regulator [Microscillaceae bacterium]
MYKYTNEKEIIEALERQAFLFEQQIVLGKVKVKDIEEMLPHTVTLGIHDLDNIRPTYYSKRLFELYAVTREMFGEDPFLAAKKVTFPGDFDKSARLLAAHLTSDRKQLPISFVQRLKVSDDQDFEGIFTVTNRIQHSPELVSIGFKLSELGIVGNKMNRLFEETLYVRENYQKFTQLTTREIEIITLLALGYQNNEIADQLFISKATVEQHRKNLKKKLEIKRFVDLIRFAQAFDLI